MYMRSKRPSRLGEKNSVARTSWTLGGVVLSSWATKNAANVAHDEQRERDPGRRRHDGGSAPGRHRQAKQRAVADRAAGRALDPLDARIVPPWVTTSAGSGPAATSASAAAMRCACSATDSPPGKRKVGSAARQRAYSARSVARMSAIRRPGPVAGVGLHEALVEDRLQADRRADDPRGLVRRAAAGWSTARAGPRRAAPAPARATARGRGRSAACRGGPGSGRPRCRRSPRDARAGPRCSPPSGRLRR